MYSKIHRSAQNNLLNYEYHIHKYRPWLTQDEVPSNRYIFSSSFSSCGLFFLYLCHSTCSSNSAIYSFIQCLDLQTINCDIPYSAKFWRGKFWRFWCFPARPSKFNSSNCLKTIQHLKVYGESQGWNWVNITDPDLTRMWPSLSRGICWNLATYWARLWLVLC